MAVVKGSMNRSRKTPQMSAYVLQKALLMFYQEQKLYPEGVNCLLPAVEDWALKTGATLKKWSGLQSSAFVIYAPCNLVYSLLIPIHAGSTINCSMSQNLGGQVSTSYETGFGCQEQEACENEVYGRILWVVEGS